jgi:hypothetical protein
MNDFEFDGSEATDVSPRRRPRVKSKSRLGYIGLAFFFGGLGAHNFYAERTTIGILQLICYLVILPLSWWLMIFDFESVDSIQQLHARAKLAMGLLLLPWIFAYLEAAFVRVDGRGVSMA